LPTGKIEARHNAIEGHTQANPRQAAAQIFEFLGGIGQNACYYCWQSQGRA